MKYAVKPLAAVIVGSILSNLSDAEGFGLEEVVVTAQKHEQSANDIGMAITAFNGDNLAELGLNDTRDMANLVPGLTMATSASSAPIYTLRGIGFNTPNFASTSPVGVYFDEVSNPYPYMSKGLTFDIERVEILKGPQGTLFGRNTTGGIINYISNRPTEDTEASISFNTANYGYYGIEGILSGALSDKLNARLAVKTDQSNEGWQRSVSRNETNGEQDRSAARLSLDYQATDDVDVLVVASWWRDKSDLQAPQAVAFTPEQPAFAIADESYILSNPDSRDADWTSPENASSDLLRGNSQMYSLSARVDWQFEDVTLTSLSSYAKIERSDVADSDGTRLELSNNSFFGDIESVSQELRLSGDAESIHWIAGVFLSSDDMAESSIGHVNQTSSIQPLRFVTGVQDGFRWFRTGSTMESKSQAAFGHVEWRLSENWQLTAGARYTEDRLDYRGCGADYNGNTLALWNRLMGTNVGINECMTYKADFSGPVDIVIDELNEENFSGRIGLDWSPNDDWLFYASASRGFKSGAFPTIGSFVETQLEAVKQEKVLAYEVGFKASLLDSSLQLNASAYHYDYTDKQVFGEVEDIVFVTLTRLVNVPKSRVRGAEIDLLWAPTTNWFSKLSVSYLDTEVQQYEGYNKFGQWTNFAGDSFEYSPPWQVNSLVGYEHTLSNGLALRAVVDMNYSAEAQGDFEGSQNFNVDDYTVFGANLSISDEASGWSASLWAKNLSNAYYWNSVQLQTDTVYRFAAKPRTFGLKLAYNF